MDVSPWSRVNMRSGTDVRKEARLLHSLHANNLQIAFVNGWCDLTGTAGFILDPHNPDLNAAASLCPSFGRLNDMLSTTHELQVWVTLTCAGQQAMVAHAAQEVVLLPKELHPDVKKRLPEADGAPALPKEADPAAEIHEMPPPYELEGQHDG